MYQMVQKMIAFDKRIALNSEAIKVLMILDYESNIKVANLSKEPSLHLNCLVEG